MSDTAKVKHALSVIKALCCGEANEHGWAVHLQTTRNRMRIADICDDALAAISAGPAPGDNFIALKRAIKKIGPLLSEQAVESIATAVMERIAAPASAGGRP